MRQSELVEQRGKEDASNAAIKIFEGMNPLESPIDPGEQLSAPSKSHLRSVAQAFGEIVTELPHVDRNFVVWRWSMGADLHIHVAEPSGPIGEQMTGEAFVAKAEPL